jgi:hypothetical protein
MADEFSSFSDDVDNPARKVFAITPDNADTAINPLPKALRVDGAGTITFRAVDSAADVTWNVLAGDILPVRALYVRSTGTNVTVHGLA